MDVAGGRPLHYEDACFVTIDAPSTNDVDDAIWVARRDTDYRVVVAIADPTGLVLPGSTEDENARLLGSTVYQRDKAVRAMLPRRISEDAGSLTVDKVRKAFAIDMVLDEDLNLTSFEVERVRIKVSARLSHSDIPVILQDEGNPLRPMIGLAVQLSKLLLQKRRNSGALALYDISRMLMTDEEGRLVQLTRADEVVGYIVVQELMVLANTAMAGYLLTNNIPGIFRNHEPSTGAPAVEDLAVTIENWMKAGAMDAGGARDQFAMIVGKAAYADKAKGHFGLAVGCYGHFTSPLRRYADLVNWRQVSAFKKQQKYPHAADTIAELSSGLNEVAERRKVERSAGFKDAAARTAERALQANTLHRLADHELVKAAKLARSAGELPPALVDELVRRLDSSIVTDKVTDCLLIDVPRDMLPDNLKDAFGRWVSLAPTRAMHLVHHAEQTGLFKSLLFTSTGEGTSFVAEVSATLADGSALKETGYGSRKRDAEQAAAARMVASLVGIEMPAPATEQTNPREQTGGNQKGLLLELCTKKGWPNPRFESSGQGPSHAMIFSAKITLVVDGKPFEAVAQGAANKREAESIASGRLLQQLKMAVQVKGPTRQEQATVSTNPIGALQELAQKGLFQQPTYQFTQVQTMPPLFEATMALAVKGIGLTFLGRGKTKQDAKSACATEALKGVKEHL